MTYSKNNEPGEAPVHDGFAPSAVVEWIADCRQALRKITCGAKSQRDALIAGARMRLAIRSSGGNGDAMRLFAQSGKPVISTDDLADPVAHLRELPPDALADIGRQVSEADAIREQLAIWASRDRDTGPCAGENSACRRFSRLRYLVTLGIVPTATNEQETALRGWLALCRDIKAKEKAKAIGQGAGSDRRLA